MNLIASILYSSNRSVKELAWSRLLSEKLYAAVVTAELDATIEVGSASCLVTKTEVDRGIPQDMVVYVLLGGLGISLAVFAPPVLADAFRLVRLRFPLLRVELPLVLKFAVIL